MAWPNSLLAVVPYIVTKGVSTENLQSNKKKMVDYYGSLTGFFKKIVDILENKEAKRGGYFNEHT